MQKQIILVFNFFFLENISHFYGAADSGDVCPEFQSQGESLAYVLRRLRVIECSYSPLVGGTPADLLRIILSPNIPIMSTKLFCIYRLY